MKLEALQYKLIAEVQSLPPELALEFCQQALRDIYRDYDWSFLYKRDVLRTPALISTGTVAVTQYSTEVVADTELRAILDAITPNDVKLEGRQFRTFGGTLTGSDFFYTITGYDFTTGTLTIDPYYMDEDNPAAGFQIFKNLYTAQEIDIDFSHFEFISAPYIQRRINLDITRDDLDRRDPSRIYMGDPMYAVPYIGDSSQNMLVELYPIPVNKRIYRTYFKRQGLTIEPDDELPVQLSYELVLARAKIKAYQWFVVNGDKVGETKKSPNVYLNLIALLSNPDMQDSYPSLLQEAKVRDDNLLPQMLITMGQNWPYFDNIVVETILLDF